jgi:hypothetical protein
VSLGTAARCMCSIWPAANVTDDPFVDVNTHASHAEGGLRHEPGAEP